MDEEPHLTLTWTESSILQVMQTVLSGIAVILNLLYLFVIKANGERLNATEVLQACKTFLILATLLITMPMQIIVVNGIKPNNLSICLLKDFMEKLLLDAYPFAIMAVAITRFRVSMCRGNSAILVTNMSAIVTFALCLLPTFISSCSMLFLYFYNNVYKIDSRNDDPKGESVNECREDFNSMVRTFLDGVFIAFGVIPVIVTISIYYLINHKVSHYRSKTSVVLTGRRRCKSTAFGMREHNMKASMILLITIFPITWFFYMFLAVFNIYHPVKLVSFCLILWKPLLFVIHPLAEGLLLQQKRYKIVRFFAEYNACKQKEHQKVNPRVEVSPDSPGMRPSPFGSSQSYVKKENIETLSLSSNSQRRYSSSSITEDVKLKEEIFEESITPPTCLHTRRTGHPIATVSFTEVNAEEEKNEVKPASAPSFIHVHSCFSQARDSHSISPYRLRCAFVNNSLIGDKFDEVLSTKTFQYPKSCLKSSKQKQSGTFSDKRASLGSLGSYFLQKDVSPCAFSPIRLSDHVDVSQRFSSKHSVRFMSSPLREKTYDNQESKMKQYSNLISEHF
ncbi:uncharacterized protein LOC117332387 [Pecten maximus]|uniref:uncharacterized protein LOC117332387 n=1 Tax=Pecten maximus TaxID=6579 RepID=UPI0014582038|nr:uncharacterized protein LOC117332387 [Pecten maximus]